MKLKKLFVCTMVVAAMLGLVACGSKDSVDDKERQTTEDSKVNSVTDERDTDEKDNTEKDTTEKETDKKDDKRDVVDDMGDSIRDGVDEMGDDIRDGIDDLDGRN